MYQNQRNALEETGHPHNKLLLPGKRFKVSGCGAYCALACLVFVIYISVLAEQAPLARPSFAGQQGLNDALENPIFRGFFLS